MSRVLTATHGANTYGIPVALTSRAVAVPILFANSGSLIQTVRTSCFSFNFSTSLSTLQVNTITLHNKKKKNKNKKQVRLPGSSKPDIVWKDCCFIDIVVPMNGVNSIYHWNLQPSGQSTLLEVVHHINPSLRRGLWSRNTPSTT